MLNDEDEMETLARKDERMRVRTRPDIPRESVGDAREVRSRTDQEHCRPSRERDAAAGEAPAAPAAAASPQAPPDDGDKMRKSRGVAHDGAGVDIENDEPNTQERDAGDQDEGAIPQELLEESDEEPPAEKRQRVQMFRRAPLATSVGQTLAGVDHGAKVHLNAIKEVMNAPNIKEIIQELENMPKLRLNARGRRTLRQ